MPSEVKVALLSLLTRLEVAKEAVRVARSDAFEAEMAAPVAQRKALRRVGDDLDAVVALLDEEIPAIIQGLALDETGSSG
jgi:hypothetical protein